MHQLVNNSFITVVAVYFFTRHCSMYSLLMNSQSPKDPSELRLITMTV